MEKHISRHGNSLALQDREGMDKIKSRALSEIAVIKSEPQTTIAMVKKINEDHIRPMDSLKKEAKSIRTEILITPNIEQCFTCSR